MKNFECGVHTIELSSPQPIRLESLSPTARNAIRPEGWRRYRFTLSRFAGDYLPTAATEQAIEEAREACRDEDGNLPTVTRMDWRIDSYSATYADLLPVIKPLVYALAYQWGMTDRIQIWTEWGGEPHSVRAMPEENQSGEPQGIRGIEFYDKPHQIGSEEQGKARLEFRRLHLNGERLSYVMQQWREDLRQITRRDYLTMLEGHAQELCRRLSRDGEKTGVFIRRIHPFMIGREQARMLYEMTGKTPQRRKESESLPEWKSIRQAIEFITDLM